MARGKIFITVPVKEKPILYDYWYSYQEEDSKGILRVYKGKQQIDQREVVVGDALEVIVKGANRENVFISPMTPPRKDWEAIAWLLGFGKNQRTCQYEEYLEIRKKRKEKIGTENYLESVLEGPNFEFSEYRVVGKDEEYQSFVCWVSEDITREEILQLIPEFMYPEDFTRRVLKERFGVTELEFDHALAVFA